MSITKKQQIRALDIVRALRNNGVPKFVTPREASRICDKFGVTNDKFRRMAADAQDSRPINIALVAVEITMKESSR